MKVLVLTKMSVLYNPYPTTFPQPPTGLQTHQASLFAQYARAPYWELSRCTGVCRDTNDAIARSILRPRGDVSPLIQNGDATMLACY